MKKRPEPARISRLRRDMRAQGIEALLATKRENVRYLTGFTGSAGSVLITSAKTCLITDFRYKVQAGAETSGIILKIQQKDFFSALREAAEQIGVKTLAFDESSITIEGLKKLRKLGLRLKGHRDLVSEIRQRKDEQEFGNIREAIRRAEEALRELKKYIRPGARERDLALMLEMLMREKGARRAAFDTIVASGRNGAMPHASVSDRRIRQGDMVTIDFGAEANGYFSDITRTYCIGKPTARQKQIHSLVLQAQTTAIKSIRPGISCKTVDGMARNTIKDAGHGEHFGHGTGHGIGLMVHEKPSVSPLSEDHVEQEMIFTVEPGVYVPGWGGVRIEDMVLVTANGSKILSTLPRELEGLKNV